MEHTINLNLGRATIGDLFIKNKISQLRDGSTLENIQLKIPLYQRPYKWTARNAIQLLDDIIEARNNNKEVYRVGTLILHREQKPKDDEVFNIVDGQQRSITFSLLLYALYELEEETNRHNISFLNQLVSDNTYNQHNIPNNLNAFRRRVYKDSNNKENVNFINDMKRLRDFIEKRCELIIVITDDISTAFQFFDSQNARGKALYPHDLLKAYHLREMADLDNTKVEQVVKEWEKIPQDNIYKFKGINKMARTPYAQFYKSAFSYADFINSSAMPFVSGIREVNAFQLNTPIIAGKPFFDYTKHYYNILKDIQDNSKYEGFYIKGNTIVDTLDTYYNKGVGNRITRLLFDTALLLYVDRFCPATYPTQEDTELFEQFVIYVFIWAYSLRAQYINLGWQSAQNYVLEQSDRVLINSLNIYKLISDSDTPAALLSFLADKLTPLSKNDIIEKSIDEETIDRKEKEIYCNYLHFFKVNTFYND